MFLGQDESNHKSGKRRYRLLLRTKRVYEDPNSDDGLRILVDRLWPRGLSKEKADVNFWLKDIAPSTELRKWFSHNPQKWDEFKNRYYQELDTKKNMVDFILSKEKMSMVTLLYGAKSTEYNNAVALENYLKYKIKTLKHED